MKIRSYILGAALVAVLAIAPTAFAHVTLQPEEAPAGGFTRLDVRVPNETDNADTTKVDVQFPPGFLSVSTEPVQGWDAEVTMRQLDKPVEQSTRELMVLELYRRHAISAGKAAALLGMERLDFIRYSGSLGIPFIDMTEDEWEAELQRIERL